jgi:hypothetical protein
LRPVQVNQAELTRLREQVTAARRELPGLRAKAAEALRAEAEAAQLRSELQQASWAEATNGIAAPMADLMRGALKQSARQRLARLQQALILSPTQTQAIDEILSRKGQGLAEAIRAGLSGNRDRATIATIRSRHGDPEAEIRALLSPEQQTAYAGFVEQEQVYRASSSANVQSLEMQHSLGLTEDQTDTVYALLYDRAIQEQRAEANGTEASNPFEFMQQMLEHRLQALAGVLTPAQMAAYRQTQELQLDFAKGLFSRMESNRGTRP